MENALVLYNSMYIYNVNNVLVCLTFCVSIHTDPEPNPNSRDRFPKITSNRWRQAQAVLTRLVYLNKRSLSSASKFHQTNLEWQPWSGSLPNGAVSIYNKYTSRTDYVCKYSCEAGFYSPKMGPVCHYPSAKKEFRGSPFQILVNKHNFEILEWKDGSRGSVPENSVKTCSSKSTFVAMNKYGLGKVVQQDRAFYLPWKGSQYWYRHYQVLTFDNDISKEEISDVRYKTNDAKIVEYPPQTIIKTIITNNQCQALTKTTTLAKTTQDQQNWGINFAIGLSVRTSISCGVPLLAEGKVEVSAQTSFEFTKGTTHTESIAHTISLQHSVPPNHFCRIKMVGHKYESNIPFTARISRTYDNGEVKWASISGTYKGVQIGEVKGVVERCEPVPHAKPCPIK